MLVASVVVLLLTTATAGAVVTSVGGRAYGVQPAQAGINETGYQGPLADEGGPVVHSSATYAIYWDPGSHYDPTSQKLINNFLLNVGSQSGALTDGFAALTQYFDSAARVGSSTTFRGAFTDVAAFPSSGACTDTGTPCITDAQLREQLSSFISANHLPTGLNPGAGATPIYFILTPPGVTVCAQGAGEKGNCSDSSSEHQLCSYHSYIPENPAKGLGTIIYAAEPWTTEANCQGGGVVQEPNGKADVIVAGVAAEQAAMLTDPLLNAWHDTGGDTDEVSDKCRNVFTPLIDATSGQQFNEVIGSGNYYLTDLFDQAALYNGYAPDTCLSKVALEPEFTLQAAAKSGEDLSFNATESVASLGIAKYRWTFGDGTSAEVNCAGNTPTKGFGPLQCNSINGLASLNPVASVIHDYPYGGTYEVTLTLTDDGGDVASATHQVVVEGPSPPAPTVVTTTKAEAKPHVSASILSRSLVKAAKNGLVVSYTVNERVAGYLEVLLPKVVAKRLGISGSPALDLPKGVTASKVIAKVVVVTTKGGHGTVTIRLPGRTAARLARLSKVSLALRLLAHNAAPTLASTTSLSFATLRR